MSPQCHEGALVLAGGDVVGEEADHLVEAVALLAQVLAQGEQVLLSKEGARFSAELFWKYASDFKPCSALGLLGLPSTTYSTCGLGPNSTAQLKTCMTFQ